MSKVGSRLHKATLMERLGPGIITGAADDDPSGIATYSQAGAAHGMNMLWTLALTFPLMAGIQGVAARIGRVTGVGLAGNIRQAFPGPLTGFLVFLLFAANTINIGADLAAMGEAARLLTGDDGRWYAVAFGLLSLLLQLLVPYHRYVKVLKWLTVVLFAYVAVVLTVRVDWGGAARSVTRPDIEFDRATVTMVVAIFGTTISPYLFFWQSSQEVEEMRDHPGARPLIERPAEARSELRRIRWDTLIGMAFSNLIAAAIMIATAATLHAHGVTEIHTAAQAAEALRPIAGPFAFVLFSLGIIGTGLLAVPVLAGSSAYAMAECQGWRCGLALKPWQAGGFYAAIAVAILIGMGLDFLMIDPMRALFWAAVINGVISVPIMVVMMLVAQRRDIMGRFTASLGQRVFGWAAALVMAAATIGMFWTAT